eukprot:689948-Prorocentrum_minimum.AAC.8
MSPRHHPQIRNLSRRTPPVRTTEHRTEHTHSTSASSPVPCNTERTRHVLQRYVAANAITPSTSVHGLRKFEE